MCLLRRRSVRKLTGEEVACAALYKSAVTCYFDAIRSRGLSTPLRKKRLRLLPRALFSRPLSRPLMRYRLSLALSRLEKGGRRASPRSRTVPKEDVPLLLWAPMMVRNKRRRGARRSTHS